PDGTIFGFLGGNGAGKTTSVRMMLDILRPDAGRIEVLGRAPSRANARQIGFLPEERGLYRLMTVLDTVVYFGRLKGLAAADATKRAVALIERLGLGQWTCIPLEKLSKGMSQKVQLATALVNAPRLLILDEPFSGLDPVNQGILEEIVREAARDGATVIFSTHVMQHAERLADRLLLLARGHKIFEGTQEEARARLPPRLLLTAQTDPSALPGIKSTRVIRDGGDGWRQWDVTLSPGQEAAGLLQHCTANGFVLRGFELARPSLHDVFVHLMGGPLTEEKP
ncbi:MAG: ATP-binding cassette domain-containing protein, partial [Alphaproteobacteria bacterium]|nr:ATP-binding cassette domain-containing protein [Alphaproteobacteria bacterium]